MNSLNQQIKALRKKAGLTQVELARRAGLGLRFIRELEQGKPTVRLDKVNRVLDFFGSHLEVKRNGAKDLKES
jgi:y4mF family transcriptional regulator